MDHISTAKIWEEIRADIQNREIPKTDICFSEIPVPAMGLRKTLRYGKAFLKKFLRCFRKRLYLLRARIKRGQSTEEGTMRVVQCVQAISYGDGVSNDALAIDRLLRKHGYETGIYAQFIDPRVNARETIAFPVRKMPKLTKNDILLYHFAIGSELNQKVASFGGRKVLVYHNVTPAAFFKPYDEHAFWISEEGTQDIRSMVDFPEYCLAVSQYNLDDLTRYGYHGPKEVRPILIPFEDYETPPSAELMEKLNNGRHKIVFTGRVVPNKKQEDLIEAFYYYKKYYDPEAELYLVGSHGGEEDPYYVRLCRYIQALGVEDVHFTGHIRFNEILAYYRMADVFLCLSEHEGFCIPLVEAMYFQKPIIAYAYTGVEWTMNGSGFMLDRKDPLEIAGVIHRVKTDQALREWMIESQNRRLVDFDNKKIEAQLLGWLQRMEQAANAD